MGEVSVVMGEISDVMGELCHEGTLMSQTWACDPKATNTANWDTGDS